MQENSIKYPKVTIITLTYNKFDTIKKTIESVQSQDYPNLEYIISDDGSIDFPEDTIIELLNKKEIKYRIIRHKENIGTVRNISYACRESDAEYIFPLSAGDAFTNETIVKRIVDEFETKNCKLLVTSRVKHSDNVATSLLPHYKDRKRIQHLNSNMKQLKAIITEMFYDMASGSAMYYKRSILEEFDFFDEKYYLWEDAPFLLKFLKKYSISFAYDIISIWYEAGGISSGNNSNINPLMRRDMELYNHGDRLVNSCNYSSLTKRRIKYRISKFDSKKTTFGYIDLLYFPEYVTYAFYRLNRKIATRYDSKILKNNKFISLYLKDIK